MGLDGHWIVSRTGIKGSAMLQDRSVLSISGTSVKLMKANNTFATLTVTITGNVFSNTTGAGPHISGRLETIAGYEILTGWVSNDASKAHQDTFVAVQSPLEGNWKLFSMPSQGNAVVKDNSTLSINGHSVRFSKPNGDPETFGDVVIGSDSMVKERAQNVTGYRLDARLVQRGNLTFLIGTIGYGTGPGAQGGPDVFGDNDTDTFTAVKVSPGGDLPEGSG